MDTSAGRSRRHPEEVAGSAVLLGMVASVPVALVSLVGPLFVQTLAGGAGLTRALRSAWITDEEDWELMPLYLLGSVVLGGLVGLLASLAWSFVSSRSSGRPWLARLVAVAVAAAVPLTSMLVIENRYLMLVPALAAPLVALLAVPRLGYRRTRRAATSSDLPGATCQ